MLQAVKIKKNRLTLLLSLVTGVAIAVVIATGVVNADHRDCSGVTAPDAFERCAQAVRSEHADQCARAFPPQESDSRNRCEIQRNQASGVSAQSGSGSTGGTATGSSGPCEDGVQVSLGVGETGPNGCIPEGDGTLATNPIIVYLRGIVQFLSVGVGIVITIAIVVAGLQFMGARGNPQAVQAAVQRLTNAIIALLLFIFMAAILNFVVPGGLV